MAQEEIFNTRDRTYSAWHRRLSTGRYIGIERAQLLAMIDLDASIYVEYDDGTKEPLALIETAKDKGQPYKTATVTTKLAQRANLPCFVLLYKPDDKPNPYDSQWPDILSFRAKRLWPKPEKEWRYFEPKGWAENLLRLREWQAEKLDNQLYAVPKFRKSH